MTTDSEVFANVRCYKNQILYLFNEAVGSLVNPLTIWVIPLENPM